MNRVSQCCNRNITLTSDLHAASERQTPALCLVGQTFTVASRVSACHASTLPIDTACRPTALLLTTPTEDKIASDSYI
ncbi:hypothetical protein E2C01_069908 [Portunus trituberculatus]|uniref:Uncharacterized protein n=1 Tax=Portunus trituberculatus TaxID=210409 RepID=A0A5B7I3Q7_PORTR|nr:hypothetical protein [Portunus trituberculatus]